ncbi:MAG: ArsA family ATPase [Acidimicrobiales bacterium]|nr:ArsA family ATPase [Acidimicrobiales bacterium]
MDRPPRLELLERRLLFVTGKGGVGKTSVAAALGLLAAERGQRTLIVEIDAKGSLSDVFESGPMAFAPRQLAPNLFAMAMDTEESLKEYLRLQLRVPLLGRIGPLAKSLDFVATAAPGVKEILTVGKIAWEVKERHYDLVVVDASATGHVVGQLAAPEAINDLVKVGRVRDQTRWMLDLLSDPVITGAVVVATPEEMPVTETLELVDRLETETQVPLAAVVVNKVLPELFGRGEEEVFDRLQAPEWSDPLSAAVGGPVDPVFDGARLAVTLRRTRAEHITRLRDALPANLALLYVPYLFTRAHGLRATHNIADALGAELGY